MRGIKAASQYHEENTGLGYLPFKIKEGTKEPVIVRVLAQAEPLNDDDDQPIIQSLFIHREFKVLNSTRCTHDGEKADPDKCPLDRVKAPRSLRTYIPVIVKDDEKRRVHIIEYGRDNLAEVQEIISECPEGDITKVAIKITRHGKGTSTQYKWRIIQNSTRDLTDEELNLEIPDMEEAIPIKSWDELEKIAMQYERSKGVKEVSGDGSDADEGDEAELDEEEIPF